jgi:hypothetical protein
MEHNVGNIVRIQSQKWIDAQEKDNVEGGIIAICRNGSLFVKKMFQYAGKIAKIVEMDEKNEFYKLDIDGAWGWQDWMFDPDYRPEDEPLSPEDAIRAMLDGETLYNKSGIVYTWNKDKKCFYFQYSPTTSNFPTSNFSNLYRRPAKRTRYMTTEEISTWVRSEASHGWMVRNSQNSSTWTFPNYYEYTSAEIYYQRAKLLPDLSGIDESTIQGFEVEE